MFIGHFGVGFGAKKFAPTLSLALLFTAVQFLDLLWPTLLLLDVEHVKIEPGITKMTPFDFTDYPISHSLAIVVLWGLLFGGITWLLVKNVKYAFIIFLCVISHWFLDLLVHRPDLPLAPGETTHVGLGLWNYPIITVVLELLIFSVGIYWYYRTTAAKNRFGKFGLIGLTVFLLLIQVGNMAGPPPPDVTAIAWAGQLQWLFVLLAYFVDRNRMVVQKIKA